MDTLTRYRAALRAVAEKIVEAQQAAKSWRADSFEHFAETEAELLALLGADLVAEVLADPPILLPSDLDKVMRDAYSEVLAPRQTAGKMIRNIDHGNALRAALVAADRLRGYDTEEN